MLFIFFLSVSLKWGVTNHPFHPPGSALGNSLPSDVVSAGTLSQFKVNITVPTAQ